jgi:hypothetical protein
MTIHHVRVQTSQADDEERVWRLDEQRFGP